MNAFRFSPLVTLFSTLFLAACGTASDGEMVGPFTPTAPTLPATTTNQTGGFGGTAPTAPESSGTAPDSPPNAGGMPSAGGTGGLGPAGGEGGTTPSPQGGAGTSGVAGASGGTAGAGTDAVFEYQNPITSGIDPNGLRDCQVFRDGDWWYMTGTSYPHWERQEEGGQLNPGVALYRSSDITHWEFLDFIVKRPGPEKWYHRRFWAPEIQKVNGKYYALFNARNDALGYAGQFMGYAVADNVEGPYTVVTEDKPISRGNDLTLFQDEDGTVWALWNTRKIWVAKIDLANAELLTEPKNILEPGPVEQVGGQDKYLMWDSIGIEGAYVIKRDETYYLFYSSWTRGYEIGYATAPRITGPWTKHPSNPLYGAQKESLALERGLPFTDDPNSPFNAVGHNEVFTGPDGRLWLSAHGIVAGQSPMLVIDPIDFDPDGTMRINGPTYTKQTVMIEGQ